MTIRSLGPVMTLYACMDELLDEMELFVSEHYGSDSAAWRSGDFAAGALLEFKGRHGDGRVGHWTVADVSEFLLGWFPRTVGADEDLRRDVPDCAAVFFRFMAARGTLTGDAACVLEAACVRLRDQFLGNCRDPRTWGPGKVRLSRIVGTPAGAPARDEDTRRTDPRQSLPRWRRQIGSGA